MQRKSVLLREAITIADMWVVKGACCKHGLLQLSESFEELRAAVTSEGKQDIIDSALERLQLTLSRVVLAS